MDIRDYLKDNILPYEHVSTERIVRVAKRYTLVEGDLYQRGANGVLMRFITQKDGYELLTEIHGGECSNHDSSRTMVDKAFRHDFYWPTTLQDVIELVKRCKMCQFHTKWIHTGIDTTNDPTLMVICCMRAGHPGSVPQGRWKILVSIRRH
jgi:hypothetical protein